ncbi:MFS transporter permease [Microbacterium sp.]|uniref:MFS transporter permease n=1 Tax=Microbacterium sp. TaxID=51671 RepID=UPI000927BF3D|nr:MFS transporter permease [Microbacterium sp.]OJU69960.1 MAG: MFS transporter permease [Microbacterium sp. 70-38]
MWLRRAFFGWLFPAAFLLPLWLLVGWGVFNAGGWAFLWVLLLAIPSVFVGQLVLALLVRARGTVRARRAVSWWDVAGFTVWHGLTISLGFFAQSWWAPVMILTVFVGVGLVWLELWQLWREARPLRLLRTSEGLGYIPPPTPAGAQDGTGGGRHAVIIVSETDTTRR